MSTRASVTTRPLRVLIAGQGSKHPGGVASVTRLIVRYAADYRLSVREVDVQDRTKGLLAALIFGGLLLFCRPDLVHLQIATKGSIYRKSVFACLCRLLRIKVVSHIHGHNFFEYIQEHRAARWAATVAVGRSSMVLVLGANLRQSAIQMWPWAGKFTRVVPNAVPENPFRERKLPQMAFVGSLDERKGVDRLLAAYALTELNRQWRLVIAGPGLKSSLERFATELGIHNHVTFLGILDETEVQRLLSASAVLVLPSKAEGLPMAVLESLASGTPVVATDVGATSEAVVTGMTGYLLPKDFANGQLSDALLDMQRKFGTAEYEALTLEARAIWERKFSPSVFMSHLCGIYAEVLEPK